MFDFGRPLTRDLDLLQREMERYLDHISRWKPPSVVYSQRTWQPSSDVYETEDAVIALIEMPGVSQDQIDLVVEPESLTLRGERKEQGPSGNRRYSNLEIPFGPFERKLQLPASVNPGGATASYHAGFLEVVMPKLGPQIPQRIGVKTQ
jgi:HSP20 family protein